jgi:hypothetical protein
MLARSSVSAPGEPDYALSVWKPDSLTPPSPLLPAFHVVFLRQQEVVLETLFENAQTVRTYQTLMRLTETASRLCDASHRWRWLL